MTMFKMLFLPHNELYEVTFYNKVSVVNIRLLHVQTWTNNENTFKAFINL